MTQGGKPCRASTVETPTPSAFVPLRPFLKSNETDLSRGLENLSGGARPPRLPGAPRRGSARGLGHPSLGPRMRARPFVGAPPPPRWKEEEAQRPGGGASRDVAADRPGEAHPFEAFITGRLLVGGDTELAKRLVRHLSDPSVPYVSPCSGGCAMAERIGRITDVKLATFFPGSPTAVDTCMVTLEEANAATTIFSPLGQPAQHVHLRAASSRPTSGARSGGGLSPTYRASLPRERLEHRRPDQGGYPLTPRGLAGVRRRA